MCGSFYARTSYFRENSGVVNINEKLVIDLDNDTNHDVKVFVDSIPRNNLDQIKKDYLISDTLGGIDLEKSFWPNRNKSFKLYMLEDEKETDLLVNIDAFAIFEIPSNEIMPCLLEGNVMLCGREVLYQDANPFKYPPNQFIFNSWECVGKFDSKYVNKGIIPLCVPNRYEFERKFNVDYSYDEFLKMYKLTEPDRQTTNLFVPHVFIMPPTIDEFIDNQFSGDYESLLKEFKPGELVSYITKGPILRPAKMRRIGLDCMVDIEYHLLKDNDTVLVQNTVSIGDIIASEFAGPNVFIDFQTHMPKSISNCEFDIDLKFTLESEDIELFCEAVGVKANAQYFRKLSMFRK